MKVSSSLNECLRTSSLMSRMRWMSHFVADLACRRIRRKSRSPTPHFESRLFPSKIDASRDGEYTYATLSQIGEDPDVMAAAVDDTLCLVGVNDRTGGDLPKDGAIWVASTDVV